MRGDDVSQGQIYVKSMTKEPMFWGHVTILRCAALSRIQWLKRLKANRFPKNMIRSLASCLLGSPPYFSAMRGEIERELLLLTVVVVRSWRNKNESDRIKISNMHARSKCDSTRKIKNRMRDNNASQSREKEKKQTPNALRCHLAIDTNVSLAPSADLSQANDLKRVDRLHVCIDMGEPRVMYSVIFEAALRRIWPMNSRIKNQ